MTENYLVRWDRAKQAIIEAHSVDELKLIRDQAEAYRYVLKLAGEAPGIIRMAEEIKVRAERRAGEMLINMPKATGGDAMRARSELRTEQPATYSELGIDKRDASIWQRIAEIPEKDFEQYLATVSEITTTGALKIAKKLKQQKKNRELKLANSRVAGEHDGGYWYSAKAGLNKLLETKQRFGTVYIDPPWKYSNQSTRAATDNHYSTMTVNEIADLPIQALADNKCHLHLWTTNAFLFESKALLERWGFEYKSVFVWVKPQIGIGNYWRVSHEFLILGVRGGLTFLDNSLCSWLESPRTKHSQKPDDIRALLEKASPAPRLEMFARAVFPGWHCWGDEVAVGLFDKEG